MIRLFLRFYGVLIATLVFSFVVQMQLMDLVWREVGSQFDWRARFRPTFHLLEEALAAHPEPEWPARFASLSPGFGVPARLQPTERMEELGRMDPGQKSGLERGAIVSLERPGGGMTLVKLLRTGRWAAAIDVPGPPRERIKLITYAANWSVEFTVVAILVWFWVRPFWGELLSLRRAADEAAAGRFDTKAVVRRGSVLRQLADALNHMTAQVAVLLQSHRSLTAAVSHELRTPIARLRFSHDLAREEPLAEAKDRLLARMERDIDEIEELTSELLDYARLERGIPAMTLQLVPVEPWMEEILSAAGDELQPSPPRIETRLALDTIRCEPRHMARAVLNLVRNARAHAASAVVVRVERDGQLTRIHVDDDGPGIAAADRERVLEPFVRLDESRDRRSGGFGLGLAIAAQIARWHRGSVRIADSPLGGCRVTIAW